MKRAIGIVRVSSQGQVDQYGPSTQQDDLQAKAQALNAELTDVWAYHESASDADNRPKFERLLRRLVTMGQADEISMVIFGRPDRLGRDGEAAFFYYLHLLEATARVEVRFAVDDVEPNDTNRNFLLFLHAFKAKTDAATIRRNTAGGRRKRAESGKLPTGNYPWPFDYDTRKDNGGRASGKPTINSSRAEWVRTWMQWLTAEGVTLMETCRRMEAAGVVPPSLQRFLNAGMTIDEALANRQKASLRWHPSAITRILKNTALLGKFDVIFENRESYTVISDPGLAILTESEFARVQNVLTINKQISRRTTKRDYTPLQGFIWCHCGRKAGISFKKPRYAYARCNVCRDRDDNIETMWDLVREKFTAILTDPYNVLPSLMELKDGHSRKALENQRRAIQEEIGGLDKSFDRVTRAFAILEGYREERLREQVADIKAREKRLRRELVEVEQSLKTQYETALTREHVEAVQAKIAEVVEGYDAAAWRVLFKEFDLRVILQKEAPNSMRVSLDGVSTASPVFQQV